jgi:hypothetical protein
MMTPTDAEAEALTEALSRTDRAALELAIEVTRRESPARRKQIDDFLSDPLRIRPWIEVATFAAGCAQGRALNLQPWEFPPCHISDIASALNVVDDLHGYRAAAQLRPVSRAGIPILRAIATAQKEH